MRSLSDRKKPSVLALANEVRAGVGPAAGDAQVYRMCRDTCLKRISELKAPLSMDETKKIMESIRLTGSEE